PTLRESQPCGLRALAKGPLRPPRRRHPRRHPPVISGWSTRGPARHTCGVRMNRPILEVRDLRTYFFPEEGTVRAVDGAHLDVYPRRTLGIVGESGCGKSVTARSILRIVERPGRIVS